MQLRDRLAVLSQYVSFLGMAASVLVCIATPVEVRGFTRDIQVGIVIEESQSAGLSNYELRVHLGGSDDVQFGFSPPSVEGPLDRGCDIIPSLCLTTDWSWEFSSFENALDFATGEWTVSLPEGHFPSDKEETHTLVVEPVSLSPASRSVAEITSPTPDLILGNGDWFGIEVDYPDIEPPAHYSSFIKATALFDDWQASKYTRLDGFFTSGMGEISLGNHFLKREYLHPHGEQLSMAITVADSDLPQPIALEAIALTTLGRYEANVVTEATSLRLNVTGDLRFLYSNGNSVDLLLVPEPISFCYLAIASIACLAFDRRYGNR